MMEFKIYKCNRKEVTGSQAQLIGSGGLSLLMRIRDLIMLKKKVKECCYVKEKQEEKQEE